MNRDELEHVIRAAADITKDEIVVIGSQAILGQFPNAHESLLRSIEADMYPRTDPKRAIEIDGALGDGSPFHDTFGYYAHGVGPETAKAPAGWQQRLVSMTIEGQSDIRAWCLEAHDLVLAKCAAGREHDWEFAKDAIVHGVVDAHELLRREPDLPISVEMHQHVRALLEGTIARAKKTGPTV